MRHPWPALVILCTSLHFSVQKSTPDSASYVAAVVEYSPELYPLGAHTSRLSKNAEQYVELISKAADQSADIIVFPECGLAELGSSTTESSVIPDPGDKANPCTEQIADIHEALRTISCAARAHQMYVVVNIPEATPCADPSQSSCATVYHNTDVVFDREGAIIARYRKFNLFGEPGFSPTENPEMTVFETDFGVKFGIFTCFDIIFEKPAVTLVKDMAVTDIVFPTAWFSELPFLTAVQAQVAWAHSMDVNFLGSGYNRPQGGSTGSGIYIGKDGVLSSLMATKPTTEMLVASVPKKTSEGKTEQASSFSVVDPTRSMAGISMLQDNLVPYTTLPLTEEKVTQILCHNGLCCQFQVDMKVMHSSGYRYRLAVFNGVRSFTFRTGGVQVCAIIFCANDELSSCGQILDNPEAFSTTFQSISIEGNFLLDSDTLSANTLLSEYNVMPASQFSFETMKNPGGTYLHAYLDTKTSQSGLLTFGIYGRDFVKDGLPATEEGTTQAPEGSTTPKDDGNGVQSIVFCSNIIALVIVITVFFRRIITWS